MYCDIDVACRGVRSFGYRSEQYCKRHVLLIREIGFKRCDKGVAFRFAVGGFGDRCGSCGWGGLCMCFHIRFQYTRLWRTQARSGRDARMALAPRRPQHILGFFIYRIYLFIWNPIQSLKWTRHCLPALRARNEN